MQMLPPSKDKCQICAVEHEPHLPHNPQSLYYQMSFHNKHGRSPTWADALAHCPEIIKNAMSIKLGRMGIDMNSPDITGGIKTEKELNRKMKKAGLRKSAKAKD